MKKILIYSVFATILGLILTLVPLVLLITPTENTAGSDYAMPSARALSKGLEKLEGTYAMLDKPKYSFSDLGIIALSFMIALFAYVFFKFKMPH